MIGGASPRFKPPLPGWRIAPLAGLRPPAGKAGALDLRVGYCAGVQSKTIAEAAEAIDRRERAGDPVAAKGDLRSSLVPVVVVDGEPVATGWGRMRIPLAAGRHLVEVQSQHSRAWHAVDIAAGQSAKVDYIGMLGDRHRSYGEGTVTGAAALLSGYALGPRGRLHYWQYLPALARGRLSFAVFVALLVAAAPVTWLAGLTGVPLALAIPIAMALPVLGLAFWGARVLWTFLRYNRIGPAAPLSTGAFTRPGLAAPVVLDPAGTPPPLRPGSAAVLVDARFLKDDLTSPELALQLPQGQMRINGEQRKALDRVGELVPIRHRRAVPPPEIEIDGVRVAASWTRMWIETAPGRHRVRVRTPEAPLPVPSGQAPPQIGDVAIDAAEGATAALELTIAVEAVPDPTEPLLHQWQCRIERLAPALERPVPAAPKADVRGGLRRAATGRWWERADR